MIISSRPKYCPNCGKKTIAEIIWGMPFSADMEMEKTGKVIIGGCIVSDNDPTWRCRSCDFDLYDKESKMASPLIYTFGYEGWGPHLSLLKKTFEAQNMLIRGRGLRWVDVRLKKQSRAKSFTGSNPEKLFGSNKYTHIKELGNESIATKSNKIKLFDQKLGYAKLENELLKARAENKDLILFCSCIAYDECHRKKIVESSPMNIKKAYYKNPFYDYVPEWPPVREEYVEINLCKLYPRRKFKFTNSDILHLKTKVNIPGYVSPLVIPYGVRISFYDEKRNLISGEVYTSLPSSDGKYAYLKLDSLD